MTNKRQLLDSSFEEESGFRMPTSILSNVIPKMSLD